MKVCRTVGSVAVALSLAAVPLMGLASAGCGKSATPPPPQGDQAGQIYTCPMHPNVRQDKPGTCPECKMDLVPADQGANAK